MIGAVRLCLVPDDADRRAGARRGGEYTGSVVVSEVRPWPERYTGRELPS